jgi:hypothetical protein
MRKSYRLVTATLATALAVVVLTASASAGDNSSGFQTTQPAIGGEPGRTGTCVTRWY